MTLKKDNYALNEKYGLLQKRYTNLEDQYNKINVDLKTIQDQKWTISSSLEQQNTYVAQMEEKIYKSNKISLEILKQLKDAEVEIDCLKQYIVDLKTRINVYLPVKEDFIDKRLADYINNYPDREKLKLMFLRDSPGVYLYGTRRINLKIEKAGTIKVRVGGGYLSIDEFIDQYTPQELEKIERLNTRSASPLSDMANMNIGRHQLNTQRRTFGSLPGLDMGAPLTASNRNSDPFLKQDTGSSLGTKNLDP